MSILHHRPSTIFSRNISVLGLAACLLSASVVQAGTKCYDFSQPPVGTEYHIGDTLNLRHSVINVRPLVNRDGPASNDSAVAEIHAGNLPQGGAPSLRMSSIVAQVIPNKLVKTMTLKFAQNLGSDPSKRIVNIGVNGQSLSLNGSLDRADGKVLGKADKGGKVRISVQATPDGGDSYWVRGTVTLTSASPLPLPQKGIKQFSFGASTQLFIDDVCMTEK
ncbi:MAG: hypothetical protein MRJ96_09580 [Nitrospirales bacterium]|nr:hypothetical protein [Nitrospira sp.]MDR4501685.1 hypothetical protein [Nitrospirales bacterium]